jgi:tRNA-modifying protein YgfZ
VSDLVAKGRTSTVLLPTLLTSTDERVITVTGADRHTYLDATTSQRIDGESGITRGALVLEQHGTPLAMLEVVVLIDRIVLLVPDEAGVAVVMDVLAGRTFLADARFVVAEEHVVLRLHGDEAVATALRAGIDLSPGLAPGRAGEVDGVVVACDVHGSVRLVGSAEAVAALAVRLHEAGAADGDEATLETWRVVTGIPAWGREVTPPHLPEEAGVLPTHVHLAKGCYPGQEAVARMWMLGRPRRRLVVLASADDAAAGTEEAVLVGPITSVAPGADRSLAYVPTGLDIGALVRSSAGAGAAVAAGAGPSASGLLRVVATVGADDVPPGHDPAVVRRRDRR